MKPARIKLAKNPPFFIPGAKFYLRARQKTENKFKSGKMRRKNISSDKEGGYSQIDKDRSGRRGVRIYDFGRAESIFNSRVAVR